MEFFTRTTTYEQQPNSNSNSNSTYRHGPPPPSSNYTYFTEQALISNYNPNHDFGRYNHFYGSPMEMQEAMMMRQLEKERIREEILAAEQARRRELEEEVRRDLMFERELEMRRIGDGFSWMPPGQQAALPSSQYNGEGRSLEERIVLSLEERYRGYTSLGRLEIGGFQKEMPFQRSAQPQISEVKPVSISEVSQEKEKEKKKDKIIFLAKPDANLSGTKRKAATPTPVGSGEIPSIGWKKKVKEEWSCAICQVSATSERGLNEHLQGKRHKAKEAGLRAQKTGKNFSIGLCSKKPSDTKPAVVTKNPFSEEGVMIEGKSLQLIKSRDSTNLKLLKTGSLKKNEAPFLQIDADTDNSKKKSGKAVRNIRKIPEDKKKKFKFWCEMCQAGAFSEKVMNNHKEGKKHVFRLQELNKKGEALPGNQIVEVTLKANKEEEGVEDGREVAPEAVDGVEVEDHQAEVSGSGSN